MNLSFCREERMCADYKQRLVADSPDFSAGRFMG